MICKLCPSPQPPSMKRWQFDKQLALLFPALVILVALYSGSLWQFQVTDNRAALFCIGLFIVLVITFHRLLKKRVFCLRTEWFIREFWPVLAIIVSYLLMRILRLELAIEFFVIPQRDQLMIQFDNLVFGQTPSLYIQYWITPTLTLLMETAYLHFYYLLPIGSLLYFFWQQQAERFIQMRKAIIYTQIGGFCCYFIMPVKGPSDFMSGQFMIPLNSAHEIVYDAVNSFRFAYDCFPSLHTALPWVTLFLTWSWHKPTIRIIILAMTLSITLSTMYLRYHYAADVLAGFFWAFFVAWIIKRNNRSITIQ